MRFAILFLVIQYVYSQTFSPSLSYLNCSSVLRTNATLQSSITLVALDTNGLPYTAGDLNILTTLTPTSYSTYVTVIPTIINTFMTFNGSYFAVLSTDVAATYQITVSYQNVNFDSLATIQTYGPTPTTYQAGGFGTYKIIGVDTAGNPVPLPLGSITYSASYLSLVQTNLNLNRSVILNAVQVDAYLSQITVYSYQAGVLKVLISYNGKSAFASGYSTVQVTSGALVASSATMDWSFFNLPRKTGATSTTLCVIAHDLYGNLYPPLNDNRFFFTATASLLDSNNVTVNSFSFTSNVAANQSSSNCNSITFGPITATGNYLVSVTSAGVPITASPKQWKVTAGFIDPAVSTISGISDGQVLNMPNPQTFRIQLTDSFGNPAVVLKNDVSQTQAFFTRLEGGVYPVSLSYDNTTTYFTGNFTFPISGNFTLTAQIYGIPVNNSGISVYALSPTSASNTTLVGDGASFCQVNVVCRFVIQLRDQFGRLQYVNPGDTVSVQFLPSSAAGSIVVTALPDDQYAVEYQSLTSGSITLQVSINGVPVTRVVSVAMSDQALSITVGVASGAALLVGCAVFMVYKHRQAEKMKAEWERMKRAVYGDYNINEEIKGTSTHLLTAAQEEEWDDDGEPRNRIVQGDEAELEVIQSWVAKK